MVDVACTINVISKEEVGFTWSQGKSDFENYYLTGICADNFWTLADSARKWLRLLVDDQLRLASCADSEKRDTLQHEIRSHSYELAKIGHQLYKQIFLYELADSRWTGLADEIAQWLAQLTSSADQGRITLELALTGKCSVPWNIVYDREPTEVEFLVPTSPSRWQPFWGCRYYLATVDRLSCSPPRRLPLRPELLLVLDSAILDGLPSTDRTAYEGFADAGGHRIVTTAADLKTQLGVKPPDVIYWLSHADSSALRLNNERIGPPDFLRMLRTDDGASLFDGLAFLNACHTLSNANPSSFVEAVNKAGMRGLVGTEVDTVDTFASTFGLDFLKRLLEGDWVSNILRDLRTSGGVPLGLLYFAHCAPQIHIHLPRAVEME